MADRGFEEWDGDPERRVAEDTTEEELEAFGKGDAPELVEDEPDVTTQGGADGGIHAIKQVSLSDKVYFQAWSPSVKVEAKGVGRTGDMMFDNHAPAPAETAADGGRPGGDPTTSTDPGDQDDGGNQDDGGGTQDGAGQGGGQQDGGGATSQAGTIDDPFADDPLAGLDPLDGLDRVVEPVVEPEVDAPTLADPDVDDLGLA